MLHYISGDATYPVGDGNKIVAHCCNDKGYWGKGFVLALDKRWSSPKRMYRYEQDLTLGTVKLINVENDIFVANIIGQRGILSKTNPIPIDYNALGWGLYIVNDLAVALEATVHMPRIGCGLAGGNWGRISGMIQDRFDVDVFVYDLE